MFMSVSGASIGEGDARAGLRPSALVLPRTGGRGRRRGDASWCAAEPGTLAQRKTGHSRPGEKVQVLGNTRRAGAERRRMP